MTGAFSAGRNPDLARWTWDQPTPLRWLLFDEYTGYLGESDRPLALCADVGGLFADLPTWRYENYTLVACRPAGRLLAAVTQGGATWLGNIVVDSEHDPDRPPPAGCDCATTRTSCMEQLLDVMVLGWRACAVGPDCYDVDLKGIVRREPRPTSRTLAERPDATGFRLTGFGPDNMLGDCTDIAGLFVERPEPPPVRAVLLGCQPEPPLRAALAEVTAGRPTKARLMASLFAVDADGVATAAVTGGIFGAVTDVQPSAVGHGLLDVTLDAPVSDPFPTRAREIWDLWYAGRPAQLNLWADYDQVMRQEWTRAALSHHRQQAPDRPAGYEFQLDGQFITDLDGLYCAIGEAINGPGGYFGWNLDAMQDCLRGRWGAAAPFRLIWHHSDVAKRHLVPGYDRHHWDASVTLDELLGILADAGVQVELR